MWTKLGIATLVAFVAGTQAHSRASAMQTLEAESGHTLFVAYCARVTDRHRSASPSMMSSVSARISPWEDSAGREPCHHQ